MLSLTPQSVPLLCQMLLAGLTAAYLLSLRSRVPSTRWLAVAMTAYALYAGAYFLSSALPVPSLGGAYAALALYFAMAVTIAALVQFAYTFLADPFAGERRAALALAGAVLALLAGASGWFVVRPSMELLEGVFLAYGVVLIVGIVWAGVIHARQYLRFQRDAGHGRWPPTYEGRGHLAFGFLTDLLGCIGLANLLLSLDAITMRTFQYIALLGGLAVSLGYVVVFINYAREPTTVQVKLVGLTLATVLAFIGLAGVRLFSPDALARAAGNALPPAQTLRFTPLPEGGYEAAAVAPAMRPPGRPLTAAELADGVALPFPFPFFGDTTARAFPHAYAAVRFDAPPAGAFAFQEADGPQVAALLGPTHTGPPEAQGSVALDAGAVAFTWEREYEYSGGDPVTVQAVLRPDGSVDLSYRGPAIAPTYGLRGLWPGALADAQPATLDGHALRVAQARGVAEDFEARYRPVAVAAVDPLARLALFATLSVLVVLPLFLRTSLIRPLGTLLASVRRLEQGEREARVEIRSSDELGALATGFNQMADAVEEADRQLKRYAEDLERRVADRTASLQQALDAQRAMQAQLVQAEKLASLGQLTAGIAHEIKNPLNFVTNFAALSQDYVDDLDTLLRSDGDARAHRAEIEDLLADLRTNVAKINEHGQRADRIIRGMLLHARGGEGTRQPVDVNALVDEFLGLAFHGMRARHADFHATVERDFADDAGHVEGIPQDLGRVLLNLFNNAFEAAYFFAQEAAPPATGDGLPAAGAPGRRVPEDYRPTLRVATRRYADRVCVVVADNGPGIPSAVQRRVFEPFFTTKPTGQGTGLGLSISHDIARSHGGTLTFESDASGTAFTLALPTSADAPLPASLPS